MDQYGVLLVFYGSPRSKEEVMSYLQRVFAGKAINSGRLHAVAQSYLTYFPAVEQRLATQSAAQRAKLAIRCRQRGMPCSIREANLYSEPLVDNVWDEGFDSVRDLKQIFVVLPSPWEVPNLDALYLQRVAQALPQGLCLSVVTPRFAYCTWFTTLLSTQIKQAIVKNKPAQTYVLFTAHSIPGDWVGANKYRQTWLELCQRVAVACSLKSYFAGFQSQSGKSGHCGWLGPFLEDMLAQLTKKLRIRAYGPESVRFLIVPLSFTLDNHELTYDIDVKASLLCQPFALQRTEPVGLMDEYIECLCQTIEQLLES